MIEKSFISTNKKDYLINQFAKDEQTDSKNTILTGFSNIDTDIQLKQGVYLLGGIPSIGKTTFIVQLVDQIAQLGNQVLFISLEQLEYELTCKSLNRIQHQFECSKQEAIERYLEFADNITTIISKRALSIDDIETIVDEFVNSKKDSLQNSMPVVVIDYLQLVHINNQNTREGVNDISKKFVNMKKKHHLILFILSSLNRTNYMNQIDFESFKESGNLEYDADVVWGLQYQIMTTDKFDNTNSISAKRRMLLDAKTEDIRKVEIVCLKNRNGKVSDKWLFDYDTTSDMFMPETQSVYPGKKQICI